MEKKIDIAAILKDCPRGMELNCSLHTRPVIFNCVKMESDYPIRISSKDGFSHSLTYWGSIYNGEEAKCVIFPKGKKTWEGFVPPCKFKDGDIITDEQGNIAIYKQIHKFFNEPHIDFYCGLIHDCGLVHYNGLFVIKNDEYQNWGKIKYIRFATEEEKQKLFQAIKDRGYKWNAETKTLEKLIIPKFKVGDRIRSVISLSYYTIIGIEDDQYVIQPDAPEKFPYHIDFSLETNYELVSKFDINTLKPYDKVLVRLTNNCIWMPKFFSHYDPKVKYYPFVTLDNMGYPQCIPYKGNEYLNRTTNNCDEFYRVWEK